MSHVQMTPEGPAVEPPESSSASHRSGPRRLSRREALPIMGLTVLAVGACELDLDPVATQGEAAPDDWLARARVHRGGIQRFALQERVEGIAVRVEDVPGTGTLTVTVHQIDPSTGRAVREAGGLAVLERYEGITNETIAGIESDYFVFYYLPEA